MIKQKLKSISFIKTIILFGCPGIVSVIGFYYITPPLLKSGYPLSILFPLFLWIGVLPLFPIAVLLYKNEKKNNPSLKFKERFRLQPIKKKDILWIIFGVLFIFIFDFVIMEKIGNRMASIPFLAPPDYFPPLFNPLKEIELPIKQLIGIELEGNWLFLFSTILLHTYMMFSEEIMWRGYILPRQEVKLGKWAWLVNGILWAYLVHAVMKWSFISFLPSMLITPFIAQKTKNTWVSLLIHGIPNTILWVIILIGVLGLS